MTRSSMILASTLLAAGLTLVAADSPAVAQSATYLHDDAGHCEIFRTLSRVVPSYCADAEELANHAVRTRGLRPSRTIRFHDEGGPAQAAAAAPRQQQAGEVVEARVEPVEQKQAPESLSLAMRVQFAYDSFRLTEDAKAVLDKVAAVLGDELMQAKTIRIEGHADAHGPDDYNLNLSQLRARSVGAYLTEQHGIDPRRLEFVGKGEHEPYNASDPYDGINRRVEFHNLTG